MKSDSSVSIQFLGAAGTVTGSKHLLKTPHGNFLIDCGLFQGLKSLRLLNWEKLPIDLRQLNAVLLTHAHLDHCGHLPLLYKEGFRGKIYCTAPTRDLAEVILRDSAKIQEEDAAMANKKGYTKHKPAVPLYTTELVEGVLPLFEIVEPNVEIPVAPHVAVTFRPNGHILGSCFLEIDLVGKRIVFSGDLGRPISTLLHTPSPLQRADYLIMESTYGDRVHPAVQSIDELADVIVDTMHQKGNLLIPSFAVGRAQELMHLINELKRSNRIPDVPVYMDSPMGASATEIFRRYPSWHKLSPDQCESIFSRIKIIHRLEDTFEVIDAPGAKIVIAASGMLTGGRVLFYLEKYLENKRNTILLTGFQPEGTRGRALLDGAYELRIHGAYYSVRAQVKSLSAMSGHADQKEMLDWLGTVSEIPGKVFLVHGENGARDAFRVKIESTLGWQVEVPSMPEEFELF
ncbi:MAG: MBL fold metallo-hydrolase RNA specificity domain-containing protein [Bacteroidota bacterium]